MSEEFVDQLICLLADDDPAIVRHTLKDIEKLDSDMESSLEEALDYILEDVVPELIEVIFSKAADSAVDPVAVFDRVLSHKRSLVRQRLVLSKGARYLKGDSSRILELLQKEDSPEVLASVISLVDDTCSTEDVISAIDRLVSHVDSRVRANSIEAMERLNIQPDEDVVELLLQDSSPRVKANIIKLRWPLEQEKMEEIVLQELKSPDIKRQRCALYLLGVLSPFKDVASILTKELGDENVARRSLVVKGLSRIDSPLDYIELARAYLKESDQAVSEAIEELLCRNTLSNEREEVFRYLFSIISDDASVMNQRIRAAGLLSRLGGSDAVSWVKECLLIDSAEIQLAAISELSEIDDEEVKNVLNRLKHSPYERVSALAILELCYQGSIPPPDTLMEMISSDNLFVVRCGAMALARFGTVDTLSVLVDCYRKITGQVIVSPEEAEVKSLLLSAIESIRSREER